MYKFSERFPFNPFIQIFIAIMKYFLYNFCSSDHCICLSGIMHYHKVGSYVIIKLNRSIRVTKVIESELVAKKPSKFRSFKVPIEVPAVSSCDNVDIEKTKDKPVTVVYPW